MISEIGPDLVGDVARLHEAQNQRPANLDYIMRCIEAYPSSLARIEGKTVGFAYTARFAPDILTLSNLLVSNDVRGQGIGTRLLEHVEDQATGTWTPIILSNSELWPHPPRRSPLEFYIGNGYKEIWCTQSTVVMVKGL